MPVVPGRQRELTLRQRQIVHLQREGLCYKEIASRLGISVHTVKTHFGRIFKITGVRSSLELQQKVRCSTCANAQRHAVRLNYVINQIKEILAMNETNIAAHSFWPPYHP